MTAMERIAALEARIAQLEARVRALDDPLGRSVSGRVDQVPMPYVSPTGVTSWSTPDCREP